MSLLVRFVLKIEIKEYFQIICTHTHLPLFSEVERKERKGKLDGNYSGAAAATEVEEEDTF